MDPLTSLSLTCAIVQLVEFSSKLIKSTAEIYSSATGVTSQDETLKRHAQHLKDLTSDVDYGTSSPSEPLEKNLQKLTRECQKLSEQLLSYLEKAAAKDGSLTASVMAAWGSLRHKGAKKELQSQLDSCQGQLTLYLNALMRSEIKERLESLAQSQESNAQQFASLEGLIGKLREGVHVTSLDGDIKSQLSELLGLSGRTYDAMRKGRILKSLSFETIHRRIDEVHSAHVGTFDWILHEGSFVDWLSHGQGVFHVAGKPGSGKSTLMRFLCHDPRTEEFLEEWAAGSYVVRAKFFFWRHGESDLQRNLEGLFRGLLHDSLYQCPDLIPDVLPDLWKASKSSSIPWPTDSVMRLNKDQIRDAFFRMINNRELYRSRRFCFFIDGLDEYKETSREDYGDLVQLLFEWIEIALQDVKICVSSRELTIFETGHLDLDPNLKLRLHQLTKNDIETLVEDRLSSLISPTEDEDRLLDLFFLRQAVIERADGVFLWVNLVLNSLRQGWADGDTLYLLLEKVNSMPPELDDLFGHLLMSVAVTNRQRAYLMMAVAMRLEEVNCTMSPLFYFFVTEFYNLPFDNAIEDVQLDQSDNDERIAMARRRIMAYSKGLLEVAERTGKVAFSHRSVCDFLRQENVQTLIQEKVKSSHIQKAICLSSLAELRALKDIVRCNLGPVLSICKADWRDDLTPGLLDRIDQEICQPRGKKRPKGSSLPRMHDVRLMIGKQQFLTKGGSGSLTCEAGRAGMLKYIKWKLNCCPSSLDGDKEAVQVCAACVFSWIESGDPGTLSVLEFMLDSRLPPNEPGQGRTVWLLVLMAITCRDFSHNAWHSVRCSQLMEIFLLRGAETKILFRNNETQERRRGYSTQTLPTDPRVLLYVGEEQICYEMRSPRGFCGLFFMSSGRHGLTLSALIDRLKLHNAERLKAMVDRSSGDRNSGLGDCTPAMDMSQLTDAPRVDSSGRTWTELLGIYGPFFMISIAAACAVLLPHTLATLFGTRNRVMSTWSPDHNS